MRNKNKRKTIVLDIVYTQLLPEGKRRKEKKKKSVNI